MKTLTEAPLFSCVSKETQSTWGSVAPRREVFAPRLQPSPKGRRDASRRLASSQPVAGTGGLRPASRGGIGLVEGREVARSLPRAHRPVRAERA